MSLVRDFITWTIVICGYMSILGTFVAAITWINALVFWCCKRVPSKDPPFCMYVCAMFGIWAGACAIASIEAWAISKFI